jgi:GNAT superfamily N-acetyltransferase
VYDANMGQKPMPAPEVGIFLAEANDAAAIAEIHLSARLQAMPYLRRPFTDAEVRLWFAGVVGLPANAWWIARNDTGIVGYLRLEGDILDHLYIEPEWQRRGVGTKLLAKAKSLSPHRLALFVFQRNINAQAFYAAHGFNVVGYTDGDNQEHEPDMQYVWMP